MGRQHELGQGQQQPVLELLLPVCRGLIEHQVADQLLAVVGQHHRLAHQRVLGQARFDLTEFDAQATNFHLMIEAPQVLDHPVFTLTHAVAGTVQALATA
ncbi:hypothetical protein D3C84_976980 [compost metagenome]